MDKTAHLVGKKYRPMRGALEAILKDNPIDSLPIEWQWRDQDLKRFSNTKTLFDFQAQALESALKTLWLYYEEGRLKTLYRGHGAGDIPPNRMGFWMATGSGKTLVIVKLIEMLAMLRARGKLDKKDVMFLVYRDDLLNQFKLHINEYNASNPEWHINLTDLKDYERTKRDNPIFYNKTINVFYYRADLFFEKSTAKKINPNSCDNNGEWFVLLDEAHKGDKSDSKRQKAYSNFARNGFLFNFSATFTDDIDIDTCAYNFNLEKFIQDGYGKKIYVSGESIEGFKEQDEFSDIEKQKIVLKTLILQTYIKQHLQKIRQVNDALYHNPLLLTIVNTVNTPKQIEKESDLKLFFSELVKIARKKGREFDNAKNNLVEEMKDCYYLFGQEKIVIDAGKLSAITYQDVLKAVFNASKSGPIEVNKVQGNSQELVFKMVTSDKAFALIKIGDITKWMNDILQGYQINDSYTNESAFSQINEDDSAINILMGSRTFYEGWDSNRPNLILFVNIGVGRDAKKFVLQSVGRGVRIEPIKNKRKRIQNLYNAGDMENKSLYGEVRYEDIKDDVSPLESLFVFGTNAGNLKDVINSLKGDSGGGDSFELGEEFIVNPGARNKLLLIPSYKISEKLFADKQSKYPISESDLDLTKTLFGKLSDKILLIKYGCEAEAIKKTGSELQRMSAYQEERSVNNPELLVSRLLDYFNMRGKEFDKFNKLGAEKDIIHFRKIKFTGTAEGYQTLKEKIQYMRDFPQKEKELEESFKKGFRKKYDQMRLLFEHSQSYNGVNNKVIDIKYLANHYYHPLLVSQTDKINYLTHIIDVPSEKDFIKELEKCENVFSDFDWWMFSKLDETLDDVHIPYYNPKKTDFSKFNPDFVFWLKKGNTYKILFIDPKGSEHTQYEHKIGGYTKLFGAAKEENTFSEHGLDIKVYLRFVGGDSAQIAEDFRKYWISAGDLQRELNTCLQ